MNPNKLNKQLLELKTILKEKLSTNHQSLIPILQKLGREKMNNTELNEQLLELKTTLKEKRESVELLTKQIQDIENIIQEIKKDEEADIANDYQEILKKFKENPLVKMIENKFHCQYGIDFQSLYCFIKSEDLNMTYKIPIHTIEPHEDPTGLIIYYLLKPLVQTFIKETFIDKNLKRFKLVKENSFTIKVNDVNYNPNTNNENNLTLRLEILTYNKKFNTIVIKDDELFTKMYMSSYMENEHTLENMKTSFHAHVPGTIEVTENLFKNIETFLLKNENEFVKLIETVEEIVNL